MAAGYLHLFYSDYIANNGNPYNKIFAAKEKIKRQALSNFQKAYSYSAEIEQAFEKKYNIQPNEFGAIDITPNIQKSNIVMSNFDDAISSLKTLISEGGTVIEAQNLGQIAIKSMDQLLIQGAATGGLAEGAYNQLRKSLETLQTAVNMTKRKGTHGKQWKNKDKILDMLKDIEANVSGYALELAVTYGFIGAYSHGVKTIHEAMINIGSTKLSEQILKTFQEDPQISNDLNEINNNLISNKGIQSKADSIINMHMSNGQGNVSAEATWVGFQEKNYRDISSIPVITEKTLQSLGILSFYDSDLLVNTAGSLGNNYVNNRIPKTMAAHPEYGDGQGQIDKVWNEIKNSMKLILAADAIAGKMNENFTNKVNYYVIRNKTNSQVRVIGVSRILDRIATAFMTGENNSLGINWSMSNSGRYSNRAVFWKKNVASFEMKAGPMAGSIRSSRAYNVIWAAILSTKISISLNFSSFFR